MTRTGVVGAIAGVLLVGAVVVTLLSAGCLGVLEFHDRFDRPDDEDPFAELEADPPPPAPPFDAARVVPLPPDPARTWELNHSAATFRLAVAEGNERDHAHLTELGASYAAAARRGAEHGQVLPSIDLVGGRAKHFDDRVVAAVERALFRGSVGECAGAVEVTKRLHAAIGPEGAAAPFLAAALHLAGVSASVKDVSARDALLAAFERDAVASRPAGLYEDDDELRRVFRFLRFLGRPVEGAARTEISAALEGDAVLFADYRRLVHLFDGMTNPHREPSFVAQRGAPAARAALFPRSRSHEHELFSRLFPDGLPRDAHLMRELLRRVRSGEVQLAPRPDSGWYDWKVWSLEPLLRPERSAEHAKLLLARSYKKRLVGAFAALLVKHRETHWRSLGETASMALRPGELKPRLRVEPAITYYLRTARGYAFVGGVLRDSLGEDGARSLRACADAELDLLGEILAMRELHYGLALVAAEDLGLPPPEAPYEPADAAAARDAAIAWLAAAFEGADAERDTRVIVPVYVDPQRDVTRSWATIGVRLAKLVVAYVELPSVRPADGSEDWRRAERHETDEAEYLLPVDEFAEVELDGRRVVTRAELRALCDEERTREDILKALE